MDRSPATDVKKPGLRITPVMVWNAVRSHPVLTALTVVLAATAAGLVWAFMPLPKHTAYVVYQVHTLAPRVITTTAENQVDFNSYKQRQAANVKKRLVLNNVLKNPEARAAVEAKAKGDPISWLDQNLQVDFRTGGEFMRVYLEGDQPDELLAVMKAVSAAYLAEVTDQDLGAKSQRLTRLEESIEEQRNAIKDRQDRIDIIGANLGVFDGAGLAMLDVLRQDNIRGLRKDTAVIERFLDQAIAEIPVADAVGPPHIPVSAAEIDERLSNNADLKAAEEKVAAAKKLLTDTEMKLNVQGVTNSAPLTKAKDTLREAEESRDRLRASLRKQAESVVRNAKQAAAEAQAILAVERYKQLKASKEANDKLMAKAEDEIKAFGRHRHELEKYQKEIESQKSLLNAMQAEKTRIEVERSAPKRVNVSEEPYVTAGVEGNRRARNAGMAGCGVLLLGLTGLVVWELRRRRATRTDELASALGLPLLGTIPPAASGAEQSGELVEAVDSARTVLLHGHQPDRPLRTLVVTSALPGEGKTSLSGHLAISLARAGYRTLIVDGDVHSPSVHQVFDLTAGPGLCELLRGEIDVDAAVRTTPVPGVSVLPAGSWSLATRQALVSDRWPSLRRQLEKRYDYVIVDTAPLLLMTDSLLLARNADGVILSTLLGTTQVNSVVETQTKLNSLGVRILGVVVNGARSPYSTRYGYGRYKPTDPASGPADAGGPVLLTPA